MKIAYFKFQETWYQLELQRNMQQILENKDTEENKQKINKEIDDLIENKKNQLCISCIIL